MSIGVIIYLVAFVLIYFSERLPGSQEGFGIVLLGAGLIGFVGAIALRVQRMRETKDEGLRWGHRRVLDFFGVSGVGLALYFVATVGLADVDGRLPTLLQAIWPAFVLVGTVVVMTLDHALQSSPVVLPRQQASRALWSALSAAFAIALIFPVNYLADRHDEWWDFSYFRTAEPGSATQNIVSELPKPIHVRIFQPASSDVLSELEEYFAQIRSDKLTVEVLDQAAVPKIARDLRIRDNGYIAFTQGALLSDDMTDEERAKVTEKPRTEIVRVGTELSEARATLKSLDQEVQKALLKFARGELNSYVTVGHGELHWGGEGRDPMRAVKGLKQVLEYMNLDPKKLGLTEGLGEGVPEDADVVLVLGPDRGFLPEEVKSLQAYLERGGSLLLALEPDELRQNAPAFETGEPMKPLLDQLGVMMGDGVLASSTMIVPSSNNISDRLNVATDRFSSHPSTIVLSKNRGQLKLFTPGAGYLVEKQGRKTKTTVTVRSHGGSWADKNMNLQLDDDQEEVKKSRPIAVAVEGGEGDRAFRAIVVSDASLFADFPIVNPGNQQFIYDALNWLTGQETFSGEVENEEDVRIQHTKEGQAGWFYSTVLGLPLLFFGLGMVRLRIRRRGGSA